ncbi:hypothetical protein HZ326_27348 [Fusarium oxysporum f. sp. albedinis]|nr:hypothetical protein HZ326_27348 [Fusarium oxysporum f. sp. albedinis]
MLEVIRISLLINVVSNSEPSPGPWLDVIAKGLGKLLLAPTTLPVTGTGASPRWMWTGDRPSNSLMGTNVGFRVSRLVMFVVSNFNNDDRR